MKKEGVAFRRGKERGKKSCVRGLELQNSLCEARMVSEGKEGKGEERRGEGR